MAGTIKPTIKQLYDTIIADYSLRTGQNVPLLRTAVVKAMAWAIAGVSSQLWSLASFQYAQLFVTTASLEALKRWGELVNIDYKTGNAAILDITISQATALEIPAGTSWKSLSNSLIYTAISSTVTNSSTTQVSVVCSTSGTTGDLDIGEILQITNPIEGVPDTAEVLSILTSGSEPEGVEEYRERVLTRYRRKPQGGAATDYNLWAREVGGISDCFPYVLTEGLVTCYIVADGTGASRTPSGSININPYPIWSNGQPTEQTGSGQLLQVSEAIESSDGVISDRRPIGVKVKLEIPVYEGYNISITGMSPETELLKTTIKSALILELDTKKPNIKALGYQAQDALINKNQLSAIVQQILDQSDGNFSTFVITYDGDEITNRYLGVGALAVLSELKINGAVVN